MKHVVPSLLVFGWFTVSITAWAQAPAVIGYQGMLVEEGTPVNRTVSLTFSLYDLPDASAPVWTESHPSVIVDQGHYAVLLGSVTPFPEAPPQGYGFDFDRFLYLGITVDSGPELTPRTLLAAVPSAMTLVTPAVIDAPLTSAPHMAGWAVRVSNTDPNGSFGLKAHMPHKGWAVFATAPGPQPAVYAGGGPIGLISKSVEDMEGGGIGLHASTDAPGGGTGIIGNVSTAPGTGVGGFASAGSGQTVGVGGVALSPDGIGVSASGATGLLAEGNTAIVARSGGTGMEVSQPGTGIIVNATQTGIQSTARDVAIWAIDSAETLGTLGMWSRTYSTGGYGLYAQAKALSGVTNAVYGQSDSPTGRGVTGNATAETGVNYGVRGFTNSTQGYAMYAYARALTGVSYGLWAQNDSPEGTAVAGVALATTGSPYGIYGRSDAVDGYAGYFDGDVTVTGTLSNPGGSSTIDHPLDPENQTLSHSVVESPDRMNVYNGNVRLDAAGEALVQLPQWFEALNRDFRYQLTALGGPAPNLHVAQTVSGNRFRIAGGSAGQEVSWQVTGIRRDAWAEANRIEVERQKPAGQRGSYLHPEARGLPATRGVRRGPTREEALRVDLSDLEVEERTPTRPRPVARPTQQDLQRQMDAVRRLIEEAEREKR